MTARQFTMFQIFLNCFVALCYFVRSGAYPFWRDSFGICRNILKLFVLFCTFGRASSSDYIEVHVHRDWHPAIIILQEVNVTDIIGQRINASLLDVDDHFQQYYATVQQFPIRLNLTFEQYLNKVHDGVLVINLHGRVLGGGKPKDYHEWWFHICSEFKLSRLKVAQCLEQSQCQIYTIQGMSKINASDLCKLLNLGPVAGKWIVEEFHKWFIEHGQKSGNNDSTEVLPSLSPQNAHNIIEEEPALVENEVCVEHEMDVDTNDAEDDDLLILSSVSNNESEGQTIASEAAERFITFDCQNPEKDEIVQKDGAIHKYQNCTHFDLSLLHDRLSNRFQCTLTDTNVLKVKARNNEIFFVEYDDVDRTVSINEEGGSVFFVHLIEAQILKLKANLKLKVLYNKDGWFQNGQGLHDVYRMYFTLLAIHLQEELTSDPSKIETKLLDFSPTQIANQIEAIRCNPQQWAELIDRAHWMITNCPEFMEIIKALNQMRKVPGLLPIIRFENAAIRFFEYDQLKCRVGCGVRTQTKNGLLGLLHKIPKNTQLIPAWTQFSSKLWFDQDGRLNINLNPAYWQQRKAKRIHWKKPIKAECIGAPIYPHHIRYTFDSNQRKRYNKNKKRRAAQNYHATRYQYYFDSNDRVGNYWYLYDPSDLNGSALPHTAEVISQCQHGKIFKCTNLWHCTSKDCKKHEWVHCTKNVGYPNKCCIKKCAAPLKFATCNCMYVLIEDVGRQFFGNFVLPSAKLNLCIVIGEHSAECYTISPKHKKYDFSKWLADQNQFGHCTPSQLHCKKLAHPEHPDGATLSQLDRWYNGIQRCQIECLVRKKNKLKKYDLKNSSIYAFAGPVSNKFSSVVQYYEDWLPPVNIPHPHNETAACEQKRNTVLLLAHQETLRNFAQQCARKIIVDIEDAQEFQANIANDGEALRQFVPSFAAMDATHAILSGSNVCIDAVAWFEKSECVLPLLYMDAAREDMGSYMIAIGYFYQSLFDINRDWKYVLQSHSLIFDLDLSSRAGATLALWLHLNDKWHEKWESKTLLKWCYELSKTKRNEYCVEVQKWLKSNQISSLILADRIHTNETLKPYLKNIPEAHREQCWYELSLVQDQLDLAAGLRGLGDWLTKWGHYDCIEGRIEMFFSPFFLRLKFAWARSHRVEQIIKYFAWDNSNSIEINHKILVIQAGRKGLSAFDFVTLVMGIFAGNFEAYIKGNAKPRRGHFRLDMVNSQRGSRRFIRGLRSDGTMGATHRLRKGKSFGDNATLRQIKLKDCAPEKTKINKSVAAWKHVLDGQFYVFGYVWPGQVTLRKHCKLRSECGDVKAAAWKCIHIISHIVKRMKGRRMTPIWNLVDAISNKLNKKPRNESITKKRWQAIDKMIDTLRGTKQIQKTAQYYYGNDLALSRKANWNNNKLIQNLALKQFFESNNIFFNLKYFQALERATKELHALPLSSVIVQHLKLKLVLSVFIISQWQEQLFLVTFTWRNGRLLIGWYNQLSNMDRLKKWEGQESGRGLHHIIYEVEHALMTNIITTAGLNVIKQNTFYIIEQIVQCWDALLIGYHFYEFAVAVFPECRQNTKYGADVKTSISERNRQYLNLSEAEQGLLQQNVVNKIRSRMAFFVEQIRSKKIDICVRKQMKDMLDLYYQWELLHSKLIITEFELRYNEYLALTETMHQMGKDLKSKMRADILSVGQQIIGHDVLGLKDSIATSDDSIRRRIDMVGQQLREHVQITDTDALFNSKSRIEEQYCQVPSNECSEKERIEKLYSALQDAKDAKDKNVHRMCTRLCKYQSNQKMETVQCAGFCKNKFHKLCMNFNDTNRERADVVPWICGNCCGSKQVQMGLFQNLRDLDSWRHYIHNTVASLC